MTERRGFFQRLFTNEPIGVPETFSHDPLNPILPPSRVTNTLSQDQALSLVSVFRAVQILSTVASDLPLQTFRNGEKIDNPLVVNRPDQDRPYENWVKRVVIDLTLNGNAFLLKSKNARGETVNLRVLDPNAVTVRRDTNTHRKFYDVALQNSKTKTYTDDEIQHLRLLEVPGHERGQGPIQVARQSLIHARNVRDFASNWFENSNGIPLGYLKTEQELDGADTSAYISGWHEMLSGNGVAVLSKGLDFAALALSPEDLQWLSVQSFSVTEVARLFGIPANYLLADTDSSSFTYQNLSQVNTVFHQTTLRAYLAEIEAAISDALPRGQKVKFDLTALLKTDDKARYEAYSVAITAGFMTPEYVAEQEGLPAPPKPKPVPAQLEPSSDPEPEEEVIPE